MRRCALLVALLLGLSGAARAEVVEGVAAIVGDEVVLLSEVRTAMQSVLARVPQGQQLTPEELEQLRDSAVKGLIDDKLVLQIAKQQGVTATEEEIDDAIAGIAQEEGITVDAIYAAAADQGLPRAAYREQLAKQLTRMKMVSGSVQGRVRVSEDEVRKLYDERYGNAKPGARIRVLHILLGVPPDASPEARAQMRELALKLRDQAREQGDFGALARKFSAAPSASQGGLTVFRESDAPADIKLAIEGLKPGEITDPIENAHGENLFQFLDRFDPSDITYDQVAAKLRAELVERRTMPEFEKWMAEVRKNRYVEVVAPELR
ncbi:MAG: peptidylprolyl isomerase [Myxococcota bacterium]